MREFCDAIWKAQRVTDELFDLSGRVAVVTGGLGQMGQVYTDGLVARGMRVAVFDVAAEPGADDDVRHYAVDVTDRAVDRVRRRPRSTAEWGAPHLLVNNAALDSPPDAPPEEVGPFETYPEVLLRPGHGRERQGVVLCCQVIGARDGRGGARLDRQRLVRLRAAVAAAGPLRVPAHQGRDVLQAGRVFGVEVGAATTSRATSRRTGRRPACA